MARKKKLWGDFEDPADIFGGDRQPEVDASVSDPAYDAFRRHIEEHIQGETKAFHELRTTAEHELQASAIVTTPTRRPEPRPLPSLPPAARMPVEVKTKGLGLGTVIMLSAIFAAIGFLLHSAWQQAQPLARRTLASAVKQKADPNCLSDKMPTKKTAKAEAAPAAVLAGMTAVPETPAEPMASRPAAVQAPQTAIHSATSTSVATQGVTPSRNAAAADRAAPSTAVATQGVTPSRNAVAADRAAPSTAVATQGAAVSNVAPSRNATAADRAATPTIDVTTPAEPTLKGMTVRAIELRKGPGSAFEIVDSLPPGFAVEGSLTTDRQWLRVKPGAFVQVEAVQFQETAATAVFQSFWVGPHIANIREFPLTSARILRKADPGAELKLQIFNPEWAAVMGGGFVFRKLMTSEAPLTLQLPALMRVTVEKAEIRGGPGQQYPILGLYFRNHKVEVQEMQGGWLRVGQDQYIRAQEMELSVKPNADKTM